MFVYITRVPTTTAVSIAIIVITPLHGVFANTMMSEGDSNNMKISSVVHSFGQDNYWSDEEEKFTINIPVVENASQTHQLDQLLESFGLCEVKPYLLRAEITFESLKYLSKEDIKEAIPPIGLRACFREKLFSWRKSVYGIDDDTVLETFANRIISWIQNKSNVGGTETTSASSFLTSIGNSKLSKRLRLLLEDSFKGKSIKSFYEKNFHLTDSYRGDLINTILEDIFYRDIKLSPKDFASLVDEIIENFPSEIREYYFIPRGRKANPGGKLWDKYVNQRAKRVRSTAKLKDNEEATEAITDNTCAEIDEPIVQGLKASLSHELSNWDDVKDKWQRTFLLRQKELKTCASYDEFLSDWPLYYNNKLEELIDIDFDLLHPNKGHLLFSKWNVFKKNIGSYYNLHIKDKKCKEVFTNSKNIDQNSSDYIHAILLNAVILPTARFPDQEGKKSKKISIADAIESFVVHLTSIGDYEKVITELREKYYNRDLTVQPFMIVVGYDIYNLERFFVFFNRKLFKLQSFLECLNMCFKIIHTLSLEYGKSSEGPWVFLQEYFYEIKPASERKLPSICTLHNFLKSQ